MLHIINWTHCILNVGFALLATTKDIPFLQRQKKLANHLSFLFRQVFASLYIFSTEAVAHLAMKGWVSSIFFTRRVTLIQWPARNQDQATTSIHFFFAYEIITCIFGFGLPSMNSFYFSSSTTALNGNDVRVTPSTPAISLCSDASTFRSFVIMKWCINAIFTSQAQWTEPFSSIHCWCGAYTEISYISILISRRWLFPTSNSITSTLPNWLATSLRESVWDTGAEPFHLVPCTSNTF